MTIHHFNTFQSYELIKRDNYFFIRNDKYKSFHAKSDLHSTVWELLDWIRMTNFTNITVEDGEAIARIDAIETVLDREAVMNVICGRKINRVFYEHAYDLITYTFNKAPESSLVLNNETNFFLYEEIIQLLRYSPLRMKSPGDSKLSPPANEKSTS